MLDLVDAFCRDRHVADGTRYRVSPTLAAALDTVGVKGPDPRWSTIVSRGSAADAVVTAWPVATQRAERQIFAAALSEDAKASRRRAPKRPPWYLTHTVVSVAHWSRISLVLRAAHDAGLGWLVPANKEVLAVPLPRMSMAEGTVDVLHDDTGRTAVTWPDGTGFHFLHGTLFSKTLYDKVVGGRLRLSEISALPDADQRSIALSYLGFDHLVWNAGALLMDRGVRGTALYRLRLPARIARDRPHGYGDFDYFIHMRDASHPEREFIEWVDPAIGRRGNAELCQAHAFGITLEEWLSIEHEG